MKKFLSMLLAIVMVFGFATPAMAEQTEEPVGYAPAGSVQPLGSPFGIWLYVTAPECDCGTDCGAEVRVTGGIKIGRGGVEPYNEVLTKGSKTLQVYFNSSNPVTIEAVCGSCQYDFTEWEIAEDRLLGDKVTTASESKLVIDEKSFLVRTYYTAKFQTEKTYTVKYVDGVDGEEVFADQSYTVKYNEATPAFQGDLTKYPGWKFKAWTPDLADTVTEDVTYTATWEPKGANTIIYWGNGGTRSKYSVGDTFWSEYTSDAEIKVRGNGFLSFALDEYAFNGWNTKADGTGDSYKSGDMYKFTAAHDLDMANLYAQWKLIAFNVSFNSNGGNTLDPIKVTLNKPYGTLPSAGSINGLQNLGWYLVDEQGNVTDTAVNAKTVVTLERDHTLFQKREIKTPTVKISLSRPVYNYLDKPVSLNASLTEYPALKYSYQWYKDGAALANDDLYDGVNTKSLTLKHDYVSASGVYKLVVTVTLADGSDIVVTNSPVTAEASYTLNIRRTSNMLYYNANGGESGPSNNSDYYDKANDRYVAKVQSSQPTRSEWKFIGWNTKADGTGDSYKAGDFYVFDRQLSENGGLKAWLYAQWDHLTCAENLEDVKVITEPTCTEKGLKLCRCTVCGDEYEVEIPALGHDHGGRWTWNREEHWKKCLRCGAIIDCEEHTYGDWKPVVDNKGKDTDREERSCTVCGFTQYAQTIHIGGSTVTKPTDEQNPNTGAQVPSLLPALAVLAGAAVVLGKRK